MDLINEPDVVVIAGTILCCYLLLKKRRNRLYKTRPINRGRKRKGFFNTYFLPMKANDEEQFFKYTRLSVTSFNKLLRMVTSYLLKRKLPDGISPEERLAITLHYFCQGTSQQTIAWMYHMGPTTVQNIVKETANVIWEALAKIYLKPPSSVEEWLNIAKDFQVQWNFPNCIGALDGKHICIQAPAKSGSQFRNYKKSFSLVLMACCDANYNFTLVDIGAYGSESDGGVFSNSIFGNMLEQNKLQVPPPTCLPNTNILHPYTLVADEAFPLKSYIMRPFPGRNLDPEKRIFNYRLSRARRVIENAFGILVNRWRLLRTMITADEKNVDDFVKAIVCLHNYAKKEGDRIRHNSYCPPDFVDSEERIGRWRDGINPLESVGRVSTNRAAQMTYSIRDTLKEYFVSEAGNVPWQNKVLTDERDMM